jgi:hypothetical protein
MAVGPLPIIKDFNQTSNPSNVKTANHHYEFYEQEILKRILDTKYSSKMTRLVSASIHCVFFLVCELDSSLFDFRPIFCTVNVHVV